MEQAYAGLFECFREGGGVGEVWYDLDLSSGYGLSLSVRDAEGNFPDDPDVAMELIDDLSSRCESTFVDRVQRAYAVQNPDTPETIERKRHMMTACLAEKLPDLHAQIHADWSLEEVRAFAHEHAAGEASREVAVCVDEYGVPFRDLAEM